MTQTPTRTAPSEPLRTNRLARETSPYLRQHATNPVDWYPWDEEALARSRDEDRPIFLSIGYSACHWCHVMEHESFQDGAIASFLNEHFVCIKVDREERPDLDEIYMKAVQMLCGSGGWPMSVFLTPDLKPFYGGTYFPPDDRWGRPGFRTVIEALARKWEDGRGEIEQASAELTRRIRELATTTGEPHDLVASALDAAASELADEFDPVYGGFGDAPKFPHPMELSLLLRRYVRTGDEKLLHVVTFTCDRMSRGGVYDQLGGGFHRYSTDDRWLVPHFEKMLYDNALLAKLFLEVYQVTGEPRFARIVREVLDYVLREMTSPDGGFYATQDADSAGEEGAYFVWTPDEVKDAVGGDEELAALLCARYGVTPDGNFEEKRTVLSLVDDAPAKAVGGGAGGQDSGGDTGDDETRAARLEEGRRRMLAARERREKPGRDEKILAEWNGLMITALALGGAVLGEERYRAAARRAADYVLRVLRDEEGGLLRTPPSELRTLHGTLADYAALANGLLDLYEATFDEKYFREGVALARTMMHRFRDEENEGFFVTEKGRSDLLVRSKDPYDGATPSGNSHAVKLLLRLAAWTGNPGFLEPAERTLAVHVEAMRKLPPAYGELLCALDTHLAGPVQVVIAGDTQDERFPALHAQAVQPFLPERVLARASADPEVSPPAELASLLEGKAPVDEAPAAYVCRAFTCRAPVRDAASLARELEAAAAESRASRVEVPRGGSSDDASSGEAG